ncbi:MAG: hypothetical protein QOG86_1772, partial [Thermoleophilaceae bacterium]|nr:hypothetical protein [Thermoleophilaceae bacterium]
SEGHLSIEAVIVVAAVAAILGDNVGFAIGRRWGRRLLAWQGGPFARHRRRLLEVGEPFFDRHGPKAVFFGRWVAGLRVWASWLAGMTTMPWRTFLVYNTLGAVAWAVTVAGAAALFGPAGAATVYGAGLIATAAAAVGAMVSSRVRRRTAASPG